MVLEVTRMDPKNVEFVITATRLDETVVRTVLHARELYRVGLGIAPRSPAETTPEQLRKQHPSLFPLNMIHARYVSPGLERTFIMAETGIEDIVVRQVLAADREYQRRTSTPPAGTPAP